MVCDDSKASRLVVLTSPGCRSVRQAHDASPTTPGGALSYPAFAPGQLVFISEKRLGFGSFASSNIAQRFSNAITGWALEAFDRIEAEARRASVNPLWEDWVERRAGLEEQCRLQRPKKKGKALSDCTQSRLAVIHMFTDDPCAIVVGVERTLRLLKAWCEVTEGIQLEMAGPEKRQIGGDVEWVGVLLLAAIGLVAMGETQAKLLSPHSWRVCGSHRASVCAMRPTRAYKPWGAGSILTASRSTQE